jgi:hypothetical protein
MLEDITEQSSVLTINELGKMNTLKGIMFRHKSIYNCSVDGRTILSENTS